MILIIQVAVPFLCHFFPVFQSRIVSGINLYHIDTLFFRCLGSDLCTSFIVPQLCALSEDSSPDVRTATALSFVEVCNIVGPSVTCARLLPPFCRLATDSEWSIRKAFLESLLSVAQIIPPQRVTLELTPLLRELLNDSNQKTKIC